MIEKINTKIENQNDSIFSAPGKNEFLNLDIINDNASQTIPDPIPTKTKLINVFKKLFTGEKNDINESSSNSEPVLSSSETVDLELLEQSSIKKKYNDGGIYHGQLDGEFRSGYGKMEFQNGSIYEGEWKNDKPHGNGRFTVRISNNFDDEKDRFVVYNGKFKDGVITGKGDFYYPDDIDVKVYAIKNAVSETPVVEGNDVDKIISEKENSSSEFKEKNGKLNVILDKTQKVVLCIDIAANACKFIPVPPVRVIASGIDVACDVISIAISGKNITDKTKEFIESDQKDNKKFLKDIVGDVADIGVTVAMHSIPTKGSGKVISKTANKVNQALETSKASEKVADAIADTAEITAKPIIKIWTREARILLKKIKLTKTGCDITIRRGKDIKVIKGFKPKYPSETSSLGKWASKRGNSLFIPTDEKLLQEMKKFNVKKGIPFKNGFINLSKFQIDSVKIKGMTADRINNYDKALDQLAKKWNRIRKFGRKDWTKELVDDYKKNGGYYLHECEDLKTVRLVSGPVHALLKHSGGVSILKALKEL